MSMAVVCATRRAKKREREGGGDTNPLGMPARGRNVSRRALLGRGRGRMAPSDASETIDTRTASTVGGGAQLRSCFQPSKTCWSAWSSFCPKLRCIHVPRLLSSFTCHTVGGWAVGCRHCRGRGRRGAGRGGGGGPRYGGGRATSALPAQDPAAAQRGAALGRLQGRRQEQKKNAERRIFYFIP
eukprot:SAG11_NODE_3_length_39220_cov_67.005828_26_plen_184_part_00